MKTRHGFVSNSSSSSFIVAKRYLTEDQINSLVEVCNEPIGEYVDVWLIASEQSETPNDDEFYITGFCNMDNGRDDDGLRAWLKENNYPINAFKWENDN